VLRRAGLQALRALLELAQEPNRWRSVNEIAAAQQLPAPMLEQLLLQLRRADLVEARRGRLGGYRLSRPAAAIPVARVLEAVGAAIVLEAELEASSGDGGEEAQAATAAEQRVLRGMARRLQAALERELAQLTLEELLFDLSSWQESLGNAGGVMLG
jgi:Rrf2 family transcriptional regulator, iron-sulfur cluster assembly transcription factor